MPGLCLYIPDAALREAVIEQIAAARLVGQPVIAATAPDCVKKAESGGVILIDEAVYDKKFAATLAKMEARPALLLLGAAEENDGVAESFAKPLRLGHLVARLRYYLETAPLLRDRSASFGPYRLEPQNRTITVAAAGNETIRLTEKETALLAFLAHSPHPVTRRDILAEVWGYDEHIDTHTLETHIYQLRRKLDGGREDGANWLICEAGAYRLAKGRD